MLNLSASALAKLASAEGLLVRAFLKGLEGTTEFGTALLRNKLKNKRLKNTVNEWKIPNLSASALAKFASAEGFLVIVFLKGLKV